MSCKDVIEKALRLNSVCEDEIVVIETERTVKFAIHLLKLLVLLLCNFFLSEEMSEEEQIDFIMNNFETVLDIAITELEVTLLVFTNLCDEEFEDVVELHCRDECWLVLAMQDEVNKKLEKLKEK